MTTDTNANLPGKKSSGNIFNGAGPADDETHAAPSGPALNKFSGLFKRKPDTGNAGVAEEPAVQGRTSTGPAPANGEQVAREAANNQPLPSKVTISGMDINALRLSQDYAQVTCVEKPLTKVPMRKPNKTEFVRVHPEMYFETMFLELKEENENYLISPHLLPDVHGIAFPVSLRLTVNRSGVWFLWPCRLPDEDGRIGTWAESAAEAAETAIDRWVSMRANRGLSAYDIRLGSENLSEPVWPDKTIEELIEIASRGRFIGDYEHPVFKRLQGTM